MNHPPYLFVCLFLFLASTSLAQDPPQQPRMGPGGSDYTHGATRISQYGQDISDWYWVIEPIDPKPDSAEVIVFFHGTNSNPDSTKVLGGQELFCRHIAQKGYTVIYPLYQYGGRTLPFQPQLVNAANVIQLALERLDNDPDHIPIKRWGDGKIKIGVTGISRGGGMSLNTASHHDLLDLPVIDAIVAFVPGSGRRHEVIDPASKVVIVSAEEDDLNGPLSSHNAHQEAWDSLRRHPCVNREYFILNSDDHGTPNLVAKHDCAGSGADPSNRFRLNALDFYGSWKWSVGTFNCMFRDEDCRYVFGKDSASIFMGRWSDGQLVNPSSWLDPCLISSSNDDKNPKYLVYPNPGNEAVHIVGDRAASKVTFLDKYGRVALEAGQTNEIETSNLKAGAYWIVLHLEDDIITTTWVKM